MSKSTLYRYLESLE
ncbi:hypothetical protein [Solibacillus sp. FSL R5-0449]